MIQKEVADRLIAIPGEKETGAITYAVYYYAIAEAILEVPKESFIPEPEVTSKVIKLNIRKEPPIEVQDKELMFKIIKSAFMQRRKTLINALNNAKIFQNKEEGNQILESLKLDESVRAEKLTLEKLLGAILLIGSNIFIFYRKDSWKNKKYIIIGVVANIAMGIALFLDVSTSTNFNLAIYISLTLLIPALINSLVEKIKFTDLRYEYKINKSRLILLTGILWSVMMFSKLLSYRFGEVTKIAPLCSLSVMLNVIVAYVFFKERDNLLRKIIASIFIIIGVFLIK